MMADRATRQVFFVDDEPEVCGAVGRTLTQRGLMVTCFPRAQECLARLGSSPCDLLITDVKMPDMDGIELLIKVKAILPSLPVLIVTGYGDVPMAVGALKAGAADFLEKPLDRQSLVSVVEGLLKRATLVPADLRRALTKTETSVLRLILTGKNNKEIAMLRHRSVRTIEDHRRRIMAKLGAHNLVDLIKRVAIVRFPTLPTDE